MKINYYSRKSQAYNEIKYIRNTSKIVLQVLALTILFTIACLYA